MIAEAVSAATGKNFIIDPRVRAQVTVLSATPMSPAAFYQMFLSILEVHGFTAEPAGDVIKIVPDANARQHPGIDLPDHISATSDEFVTEVVDVKNVSAAQLVPILRPMVPQYGSLAAYPAANILIISDRASNVNRLIRIIRRVDQVGDQDVEIIPLQNASAAEVVRVLNTLYTGPAAAAEGGTPVKVVADDRSNSVLVSGDGNQRLRLRALVAHIDTPLQTGGETQVRYLRYTDAEKIAPKLKEQITGIAQTTAATTGGAQGAAAANAQVAAEKNAMIWADKDTNSVVITAPPKIMRVVNMILDRLDIRRPQVHVEAIIADMNADHAASLGVNWATFAKNGSANVPLGAFVSPVGGTSIVDLAQAALQPQNISTQLLQGGTFGVGRFGNSGVNFAAMVRALRTDSSTNIIATPSATTVENEEAEMKSAQEVPFITGQYTNASTVTAGAVSPFQTVQREEVGTILKVTPTIAAEGNSIRLKISIESSSLGTKPAGAVDLTTNKRTVSTNVLIEDGGVVVLGGLIQDQTTHNEDRVPVLGSIPLIGELFKSRSDDHTKTNLMIFIRPSIIREDSQSIIETDAKYKYMQREEEKAQIKSLVPLLPGERFPRLPDLPPPVQHFDDQTTPSTGQTLPGAAPTPQGAPRPQATPAPTPPTVPKN